MTPDQLDARDAIRTAAAAVQAAENKTMAAYHRADLNKALRLAREALMYVVDTIDERT